MKEKKKRELIQAEIDREIQAMKAVYNKQKEEEEEAERLRTKQAEEGACLKAAVKAAQFQEKKEKEEARRKKQEGWTENELELLQKLKKLGSSSESEGTTMPSISVTGLEDTAHLLHQSNISLGSINEEIEAFDWAVRSGNCFLAHLLAKNDEFLLKFPNSKTDPHSSHRTTLQIAAQLGHLEIVNLILEYLPQAIDHDCDDLALTLAIHSGHREVVRKLLGHNTTPLDDFGYNGLRGLTILKAAFEQGWPDIIKPIMTKYNIVPDRVVPGARNKTALHFAAEGGHTDMMETFLSSSVAIDPNVIDSTASAPLLKAVEHGHIGIVELLLANQRVDINQKDKSGNTAFLIALAKGELALAQLFLDRSDLRANDANGEGLTALMMAASLGCSLSISKLLQYSDIDVHHRVQTTDLLWGSLPVQKEWSALEIASAKGFRYVEHLLSTFVPGSGTQHKPIKPPKSASANCYSASTSSSGYLIPGSASLEAFPSIPTYDFDHSRTEVKESKMHQRSIQGSVPYEPYTSYTRNESSNYGSAMNHSSYERDSDLENKTQIMPFEKPVGNNMSTSRDRDYHNGYYPVPSLSTTLQSTLSLSVKFSDSLSHVQPSTSKFFTAPATDTTNSVGQSSQAAENKAHSAVYARTTETLSTTVSQNILHNPGPISTSDGINWGIAAPATLAGLLSLGLAAYTVRLQRSGAESQFQKILILQNIETRLISILTFIQAAQSLASGRSGGPPSDPSPDLPTLSPGDLTVVRCLEEITEDSATESPSSQATRSLNSDTMSGYTSEDHTPDESEPTDSMKLSPLDRTGDQICFEPQFGPVDEHEAPDVVENLTAEKNCLEARFAALRSATRKQQSREDEVDLRREEDCRLAERFAVLREATLSRKEGKTSRIEK